MMPLADGNKLVHYNFNLHLQSSLFLINTTVNFTSTIISTINYLKSNCRGEPVFDGNKGHLPGMERVGPFPFSPAAYGSRGLPIKPCLKTWRHELVEGCRGRGDAMASFVLSPSLLLYCSCAQCRAWSRRRRRRV